MVNHSANIQGDFIVGLGCRPLAGISGYGENTPTALIDGDVVLEEELATVSTDRRGNDSADLDHAGVRVLAIVTTGGAWSKRAKAATTNQPIRALHGHAAWACAAAFASLGSVVTDTISAS